MKPRRKKQTKDFFKYRFEGADQWVCNKFPNKGIYKDIATAMRAVDNANKDLFVYECSGHYHISSEQWHKSIKISKEK